MSPEYDILIGILQEDGGVLSGGRLFGMSHRGTDDFGYPEALFDATEVGGYGCVNRQSVKPYIGMALSFTLIKDTKEGYNFKIISKKNSLNLKLKN